MASSDLGDPVEQQLQKELGECVLNSSWWYCMAGVALSVPVSVKLKSYNPVVYLGLTGTMLDLLNGYNQCKDQREALVAYQAKKKAAGRQQPAARRGQSERAALRTSEPGRGCE